MVSSLDRARQAPKEPATGRAEIPWFPSLLRGLHCACPRCGEGKLFAGYVSMRATCSGCGLEYEPYRADDAPAYFTILIVGHLIVPAMLLLEQGLHPETWVHLVLWMPLTLLLTLALLPRVKGAIVGVQWALNVRN